MTTMQGCNFLKRVLWVLPLVFSINTSLACTRAVYLGPDNTVLTGRTMDWDVDVKSNIWVFPQGMTRNGAAGANSLQWTSKYGSLITTFFDVATVDGINQQGLTANLLYLSESIYPTLTPDDQRKTVAISAWAQYVLDNYATVSEAVDALSKEPFIVREVITPDGHPGTGHLAISDRSGDSAIFEYINGKLVIHHDAKYQVMTNSPTFDQQLAINQYWQEIGGGVMLPGTSRPADRFVRASYYLKTAPQSQDMRQSTAEVFSIINNTSVPFGIVVPGKPNVAATQWRTISDQKNLRYYYNSTESPNLFWMDLKNLNFNAGQPTLKLAVSEGQIYAGEAGKALQAATPFKFLEAKLGN